MKTWGKMILTLVAVILFAATVFAEVSGPESLSVENSERGYNYSSFGAAQVEAQAGNVTQLEINFTRITDAWQGYYGNVSGRIVLDDADNWSMYTWTLTSVTGEVYAANETITAWGSAICTNLTSNGSINGGGPNSTELEVMFGMTGQGDGIDETFTGTKDIVVGASTLTACPATNTYVNDAAQSTYFNETLLTIDGDDSVIFATQVEQGVTGFDGNAWDFQLIVGENGDVEGTTTYYFYVELV